MIERPDPNLRTLCRALKGEPVTIGEEIIALARRHHVQFLLVNALPRTEVHAAVALTALRDTALRNLLARLSAARIDMLMIKGAGLAHTVYAAPHQRPRTDIDLFIRAGDVALADRVLILAGWTRAVESSGPSITSQWHYDRDVAGLVEHLDLHWKIANVAVFAGSIEFEAAWSRSMAIPTLGPTARTLGMADALLLACIHRVAHHYDTGPLIWVWDIHALAGSLENDALALFVKLAEQHRMRAVCIRGLTRATECFGTSSAATLIAALQGSGLDAEPSAAFLNTERLIQVVTSDVRHASTWPGRMRIVQEHLFPAYSYMRGRYPNWPRPLLPLAYAYRIARGTPAWFRSRRS